MEYYRLTVGDIPVFMANYLKKSGSEIMKGFVDVENGKEVFNVVRAKGGKVRCIASEGMEYLLKEEDFSLAKGSVMSREAKGLLEAWFEKCGDGLS